MDRSNGHFNHASFLKETGVLLLLQFPCQLYVPGVPLYLFSSNGPTNNKKYKNGSTKGSQVWTTPDLHGLQHVEIDLPSPHDANPMWPPAWHQRSRIAKDGKVSNSNGTTKGRIGNSVETGNVLARVSFLLLPMVAASGLDCVFCKVSAEFACFSLRISLLHALRELFVRFL